MRKFFIFFMLFVIIASISTGCGYKISGTVNYASTEYEASEEDNTKTDTKELTTVERKSLLEKIKEQGKFTAGVRSAREPFSWKNEDGKRVGFEIDLLKYISDKIDIDVEFIDCEFQDAIPFAKEGKADLVASIITHKASREEDVDFTVTYFMDAERFLVKKDSGIKSLDDLKKEGRKLATAQGDSVQETMRRIAPEVELFLVSDFPEHYIALQNGQADAVAGDSVALLIRKNTLFDNPSEYEIVGKPLSYAPMGMLLPEDESDWRDLINLTLNEAFKNGDFQKIYDKWFGPDTLYDMSTLGWEPEVWP